MGTNRWLILCAAWLLGCEAGPIGRDYDGCSTCSCYTESDFAEDDDICPLGCCFVHEFISENQTEYQCICYGGPDQAVGPYLNPPAEACYAEPGAQRVDACPPTRLIDDEPVIFACQDGSTRNLLVEGFALPCSSPDATRGCLMNFDGSELGTATCVSLAEGEECMGISVTACDENLAFHLTETIIEGWQCGMDTFTGTVRSWCSGYPTEIEDGYYYPIWTYPPPPIPDQCCTYDSRILGCTCVPPDACADLSGVEVSACPPPADELAALDL